MKRSLASNQSNVVASLRWALVLAMLAFLLCATTACKEHHPIPVLQGSEYRDLVEKYRGKVLLVNVWGTWCDPCLEEMPDLVAAAKQFKPEEVAVILIAADSLEQREKAIPEFLKKVNATFPCYVQPPGDPQGLIDAIDKDWGGELPYTTVYDRQGRRIYGKAEQLDKAGFAKLMTNALNSK
ncbi:MAG: TlpA family protein disulfide reductase [Leptospirales bacterium]|nr:TlpA family protein disulfide reductase [Leptospirales bacterium]